MTDYNGCYVIIKNVPCTQCTQCGEVYLNGVTLQNIERILEQLPSNEKARRMEVEEKVGLLDLAVFRMNKDRKQ